MAFINNNLSMSLQIKLSYNASNKMLKHTEFTSYE
jgi:hypothetical protein